MISSVSVVIPCFNVENEVVQALNSLLTLSDVSFEVICIDDKSTDHTTKQIEEWSKKNNTVKIKLIINTQNKGASACRNIGIENSSFPLIQFLDADDVLMPNKLADQIPYFNNEKVGIVVGDYRIVENDISRDYKNMVNDPWLSLMKSKLGITSSNLFLKKTLISVGGWNEKMSSSQEYDLMFRIMKSGFDIKFDTSINTLIYRRPSKSISDSNRGRNWENFLSLRKEILEYLVENKINVDAHPSYQQAYFESIWLLYPYNKNRALEEFRILPANFKLQSSDIISRKYKFLFKLFGFKLTEKIVNRKPL